MRAHAHTPHICNGEAQTGTLATQQCMPCLELRACVSMSREMAQRMTQESLLSAAAHVKSGTYLFSRGQIVEHVHISAHIHVQRHPSYRRVPRLAQSCSHAAVISCRPGRKISTAPSESKSASISRTAACKQMDSLAGGGRCLLEAGGA